MQRQQQQQVVYSSVSPVPACSELYRQSNINRAERLLRLKNLLGVLRTASSPEAIAMGQQPEVRQMLEEYYCVLRYKEESEQQKIKQQQQKTQRQKQRKMEPIPKRRFNPVLFAEGGLKFTVRDDCPQSAAAAAGGEDQEKLDERYCMFEMEL